MIRTPQVTTLLIAAAFVACAAEVPSAPIPPAPPPPPTVASIEVTPDTSTLVSLNETSQLTATARDANNTAMSGLTFTWGSSDEAVATVSSSGLVTAVSNGSVTITASAEGVSGTALVQVAQEGSQLVFTADPTTVLAGQPIAPAVEVAILDALGSLVGDATDEVTVAIGANPRGGTLLGTATVTAVDGSAVFDDLAIDRGGAGYSLVATSGDFTNATSSQFNVLSGLPAVTVRFPSDGVAMSGVGSTHDFQLDADDANGDPTLPPATLWSSLNPSLATIESIDAITGRASAHREGQVTIVAEADGLFDDALVTVSIPGPASPVTWAWADMNANPLSDVWATAPNDVWVAGWSGTVLHYDGDQWIDVTPGLTSTDLFGIWASSPSDVWVVGYEALLHFDGAAWSDVFEGPLRILLRDVWGSGPNDVWVVGRTPFSNAALFHFDGVNWTEMASALPDTLPGLSAVWGSGPDDVWVGGSGGTVFRFDGNTWVDHGPESLESKVNHVFGSSSTDVWVVADSAVWQYDGTEWVDRTAGISVTDIERLNVGWTAGAGVAWVAPINTRYVWRYNGTSWIQVGVPWDINGSAGISGAEVDDIWLVSHWGEIAHYDGFGWSKVTPRSTTASFYAMWGSSPSDIWAGGTNGSLLHYDGMDWSDRGLGSSVGIQDIWGTGPENIWAVGSFGTILHYDGAAWTNVPHGLTGAALNRVWGSGPGDVWAVAASGAILRFDGSAWSTVTPPFAVSSLRGVWGSSASDVWLVGQNQGSGIILHYDGETWTNETPSPSVLPLNDVWGTGATDVWAVGTGDMILHYDGSRWINTAVGQSGHFQKVWGTGPADVWALGGSGGCCPRYAITLFHYDGVSWTDRSPGRITWNGIGAIWGSRSGPLWAFGGYGTRLVGTR